MSHWTQLKGSSVYAEGFKAMLAAGVNESFGRLLELHKNAGPRRFAWCIRAIMTHPKRQSSIELRYPHSGISCV